METNLPEWNGEYNAVVPAASVDELHAKQKEENKSNQKEQKAILVQESGLMVARDNAELYRIVVLMMKGMAIPKTLDTPDKVIAAWQVAASLNIPPAIAIQNMAVIHGSVSIWGQLPKALAERTGQLSNYKIILFDEAQREICLANKNLNESVWGAAVQIRRLKRSMNEYYFTEPEAKAANLFNKSGPWKDYKKIMYVRRASGQGIKFEFSDALMGIPVAEYDLNEAPDLRDVTPSTSREEVIDDLRSRVLNTSTGSNFLGNLIENAPAKDLDKMLIEHGVTNKKTGKKFTTPKEATTSVPSTDV